MARHKVIGPDDPKYPAIKHAQRIAWMKTILGYLMMGGLVFLALWAFGFSYHFKLGFGTLWFFVPVVMWLLSAKVSLILTKSVPADPSNPRDAHLIELVRQVWEKSGLTKMPPVYISDNPLPNAFATGPFHSWAVVAATKGLFECGMTDAEIKAVFAHELGHVKNYDVALNSFISVLSMIFFSIVDTGVRALLGSIRIFKRMFGMAPERKGLFTGVLEWVIMYIVFQITGQVTKVVQMFVVRSRESGADATGALILGQPCDLAVALQKLVAYVEKHRPQGRDKEMYRALRPMMTIDPLFDSRAAEPQPKTLWQKIKAFWQYLQLSHPPVPERIKMLEYMNGSACPVVSA